jgi:hypothetical protein
MLEEAQALQEVERNYRARAKRGALRQRLDLQGQGAHIGPGGGGEGEKMGLHNSHARNACGGGARFRVPGDMDSCLEITNLFAASCVPKM